MFGIPMHPAVVHVPLGIAVAMPVLAVLCAIGIVRGLLPARTWWLVLVLQVIMLGAAFVAMRSGEEDEESVEEIVAEEAIESHEDKAKQFVISINLAVVLSIATLATGALKVGRLILVLATLATFLNAGMAIRAGKAGGELVYVHGAAAAHTDEGVTGVDEHGEEPDSTHEH
jgi:uncharacterized membrane protein